MCKACGKAGGGCSKRGLRRAQGKRIPTLTTKMPGELADRIIIRSWAPGKSGGPNAATSRCQHATFLGRSRAANLRAAGTRRRLRGICSDAPESEETTSRRRRRKTADRLKAKPTATVQIWEKLRFWLPRGMRSSVGLGAEAEWGPGWCVLIAASFLKGFHGMQRAPLEQSLLPPAVLYPRSSRLPADRPAFSSEGKQMQGKNTCGRKALHPENGRPFCDAGGASKPNDAAPLLSKTRRSRVQGLFTAMVNDDAERCQLVPKQRAGCYEFFSRLAGGQQHPGFRTRFVGQHPEQRPQRSQRSRPPTFQLAPAAARHSTTTARCGHRRCREAGMQSCGFAQRDAVPDIKITRRAGL